MRPHGAMPRRGHHGEEGPGRLYQRAYMLDEAQAEHVELVVDEGGVEDWAGL